MVEIDRACHTLRDSARLQIVISSSCFECCAVAAEWQILGRYSMIFGMSICWHVACVQNKSGLSKNFLLLLWGRARFTNCTISVIHFFIFLLGKSMKPRFGLIKVHRPKSLGPRTAHTNKIKTAQFWERSLGFWVPCCMSTRLEPWLSFIPYCNFWVQQTSFTLRMYVTWYHSRAKRMRNPCPPGQVLVIGGDQFVHVMQPFGNKVVTIFFVRIVLGTLGIPPNCFRCFRCHCQLCHQPNLFLV